MTDKDKRFIVSWEKALKLGRTKFALVYGLFFGIFVFAFATLFSYFVFYNEDDYQPVKLIIKLVVFLITGFILSYYSAWNKNNKRYNQLNNK